MSVSTKLATAARNTKAVAAAIVGSVHKPSISSARRKVKSAVAELARVEKAEGIRQGRIERLRSVKYKHVENVYASIDRDHDKIASSADVVADANYLAASLRYAA